MLTKSIFGVWNFLIYIYIQVDKVSKTINFAKFPAKYITIQLHKVKSLHPSRVSVGFRV